MQSEVLVLLSGAAGAAVIKLLDGVLQFYLQRRAKNKDAANSKKSEVERRLDEVLTSIYNLQASIDSHVASDDERNAKMCRMRVLRFNDELIQGSPLHTKEHFDDILDDITCYERYCHSHPLYKNNKAALAIENVKRVYRECEDEGSFL